MTAEPLIVEGEMRLVAAAIWTFLLPCVVRAQAPELPSRATLDSITRRGRLLAAYDQVAWHGTDAIMALQPDTSRMRDYIARPTGNGWMLVMGRLSAAGDAFAIAYEAELTEGAAQFAARAVNPVVLDTGYYLRAARALGVVRDTLTGLTRPYNLAVLPLENEDGWWVYAYPAAIVPNVWPHGADWRYHVGADGRRIVEVRQLHRGILEYDGAVIGRDSAARGIHTALLADMVEDTDVFLVLARHPRVPEYVVSRSFIFVIDVTGAITCAVRRDEE